MIEMLYHDLRNRFYPNKVVARFLVIGYRGDLAPVDNIEGVNRHVLSSRAHDP